MSEFVKVAKTHEIEDQCAKCVEVKGRSLALFNLGGEFFAIDELCTHEDAPLSEGFIDGDEVECPWHAARFNIKTGEATCPPAYDNVARYAVRVNGDDIEVELDD